MTIASEEWREFALCKGMDVNKFFPSDRGVTTKSLGLPCEECPVQLACLEFALTNGIEPGIYGGMNYRGRLKFNRKRKKPNGYRTIN